MRVEKRSIEDALETFRLFSDDGMTSVICILRPEGRYEVIPRSGGTVGKAPSLEEAVLRCREVAEDYFRYRNVVHRIERAEEELAELKRVLT